MKRCPTCNRTFTDPQLSYCIDDGTPLVVDDDADGVSVVSRSGNRTQDNTAPPTETYSAPDWNSPAYQPPGSHAPSSSGQKRRVWPWVLGIFGAVLIGIVGLGIAGAVLLPRMLSSMNRNRPVSNSNDNRSSTVNLNTNSDSANTNLNTNSNLDLNGNTNTSEGTFRAPADEAEVLAALTSLEHDWTVANINADKQALDRILADDFVGSGPDGRATGKAEYLQTIERDTVTQSWDFEDLKVSLNGPRATLSGVIRYQTRDGEAPFRFVDKFVWRDGRWQATSSEVSRL